MILFDTVPNPTYLTARRIDRLTEAAYTQWGEALYGPPNEVALDEASFVLRFYFRDEATDITALEVQLFVDAHDNAAPTVEERAGAVAASAEGAAAAIPSWAGWTEAQALAWHDANIAAPLVAATTAAQLKPVLEKMEAEQRALVRMVVALRNKTFPSLQG